MSNLCLLSVCRDRARMDSLCFLKNLDVVIKLNLKTGMEFYPCHVTSKNQSCVKFGITYYPMNLFLTDLDVIRELNMYRDPEFCPICHMPFDKGKKRKLIDACGHERCYMCMFNHDTCPLCDKSKFFLLIYGIFDKNSESYVPYWWS